MGLAGVAGRDGQVTRAAMLRRARATFLAGERLDVLALAEELGVARATVYRWYGGREALLGEVMWSLVDDTLTALEQAARPRSPAALVDVWIVMLQQVSGHPGLQKALEREPTLHLSLITSRHGVVQSRLVERFTTMIAAGAPGAVTPALPLRELAYAIVRVGEAFCYADVVSGYPVDVDAARPVFLRLLEGER